MAEIELQKTAPQAADREKRLIVVVDGEGAHLYYTSMLLQRLEYNIHTAKNAADALEIMNVAEPALVLTEISLPDLSGVELLQKLKRNPQTHKVPVMILTSSRDQTIKSACLEEGCAAYFHKPADPDVLYAAIQKATETMPRQFIRLQTCLNVMVGDGKAAASSVIADYVTALSEQGVFVSTSQPKPVGLQIPITIFLEDSKIKLAGMVLYSFKRDEGPLKTSGMGIKFVCISPEDQRIVKNFIKKAITKDLTMGKIGGTIL